MRIIGLTGGIATGKTTVANLLAEHGAVLIDADLIAREIVEPGQPAYQDIVKAFGEEVLLPNGQLDRVRLGSLVFTSEERRRQLNALTHPRVREVMLSRLAQLQALPSPPPAAVLVIPLLFESKLEHLVEEIWVVRMGDTHQRERLMARDGFSPEEAARRIAAQLPMEEKVARAHRVIANDGTLEELRAEVTRVWQEAGLG